MHTCMAMQQTWHQLPPEQVSIRMNAVDQIIPNNGYQEGSLQSLAYIALVTSRAHIPPPMRSEEWARSGLVWAQS